MAHNTNEAATASRVAALDILRAVHEGSLADRALDRATHGFDTRDRAWVQELVYGTFRMRARLDHRLAAHTRRPLDAVDPDLLDILRLGAYQLLEMHGVPSYAAVSQSVELAKIASRGAGGFVNGVLQSLRRNPDAATFPSFDRDPAGYLSTWGSHPLWLVERWLVRYGAEATRALTEANNTRPGLYVRVLDGRAAELLREAGIDTEPVPLAPMSLRIVDAGIRALDAAPVIVQDPAAALVVEYSDDGAALVVDLAAAPGGKAIALAASASPGRYVVASDLTWRRTSRLRDNVRRLRGASPAGRPSLPISVVVADALHAPYAAADMVLLDAPCTGTGTLRRHPDGRWRVTPEDLTSLVELQARLLEAASTHVGTGGLLAYATCSLEPEENEGQVEAFLRRHPEFVVERSARVDAALMHDDGSLRVLPHVHGLDGAYCALLRKHAG